MKALWTLQVIALLLVAAPASADRVSAKQAYERGVKQYNLGEYESALEAFTSAYDQLPDPALLYNLAQCHRQLGHARKAITLYRSYLRESNGAASNAEDVKKLIAELEQQIAREEAAKKTPPTAMLPPTEPARSATA
ncbi:MAG TPA: tetratricopeptide repeat protein, partial [Polyangia bacterium]